MEQAAQGGGGVTLEVFKKHVDVALQVWFSRHGGAGLTVGLDDLRGLFQPMILSLVLYKSRKEDIVCIFHLLTLH